jgi:hypothetical protein
MSQNDFDRCMREVNERYLAGMKRQKWTSFGLCSLVLLAIVGGIAGIGIVIATAKDPDSRKSDTGKSTHSLGPEDSKRAIIAAVVLTAGVVLAFLQFIPRAIMNRRLNKQLETQVESFNKPSTRVRWKLLYRSIIKGVAFGGATVVRQPYIHIVIPSQV